MDTARPPRNIIVIGAGIAGFACALALSQNLSSLVSNLQITVFERNDVLSTSGGAINLTPVAQRHLARLGVLDELDRMGSESGAEVDAIEIHSMRSGRAIGSVDFTARDGSGFGGYKGRRVMRIMLSLAMMTATQRFPNINIVFGKKVVGGREVNDTAVVHFQDGSHATADLVVGCDGVHSAVRTRWVNPNAISKYTGISLLQATLPAEKLHSRIHFRASAFNISRHGSLLTSFCDRDFKQIFVAATFQFPEREIGSYQLQPGQDFNTRFRIQSFLCNEIRRRFSQSAITCVREIVTSEANWTLYPVYQVQPEGPWSMGRVILLGDAAHAMPPRDESAAFALDDAILFARTLARYHSKSLRTVFEIYEQLRRDEVSTAFKKSQRLWDSNRDMGVLADRLKEWVIPLYLRSHENEREAAWESDATETIIPAQSPRVAPDGHLDLSFPSE